MSIVEEVQTLDPKPSRHTQSILASAVSRVALCAVGKKLAREEEKSEAGRPRPGRPCFPPVECLAALGFCFEGHQCPHFSSKPEIEGRPPFSGLEIRGIQWSSFCIPVSSRVPFPSLSGVQKPTSSGREDSFIRPRPERSRKDWACSAPPYL